MWNKTLLLLLLAAVPASAQTIAGDRFYLNNGPCTIRSGNGAPLPGLGKTCDVYLDLGSGEMWTRNAVSGWVLPGGITGKGTPGSYLKWLSPTSVGDGLISEYGAGNIYVGATGDLYLASGSNGSIWLNATNNGMNGAIVPQIGYRTNLGTLTNKFLTVHAAELWIETLVAQEVMATIGGRIMVAPTTTLTRDLPASTSDPVVIYTKHYGFNAGVVGSSSGSTLIMEGQSSTAGGAISKFEVFLVDQNGYLGQQPEGDHAFRVYRNRDGSGGNAWFAGDALVDQGIVGNGWLDIYSVKGARCHWTIPPAGGASSAPPCAQYQAGPSIVGHVRTGPVNNTTWDSEPRFAIGNLGGLYGYSAGKYGAAFGKPGGARITIEPSEGIWFYDGLGDTRIAIRANGGMSLYGEGSGVTNINGGQIQTGSIEAASIKLGTGRNILWNSECRVSSDGWTGIGGTAIGRSHPGYSVFNEPGTCYLVTSAYGNGTQLYVTNGQNIIVRPGQRMEVSAMVGNHRAGTLSAQAQWLDANGNHISYGYSVGSSCDESKPGGVSLNDFCHLWTVTEPAPGNAVAMRFYIFGTQTSAQPYIFFTRAYVGEAGYYQTTGSAWSPAGITEIVGGMISTNAIKANHIAADQIVAGHIAANSINATHITAGAVTATKINVGSLSAISADLGAVYAGYINGVTIEGNTIRGNTITGGNISGTTIDGTTINGTTINGGTISGTQVNAYNLNVNNSAFRVDEGGKLWANESHIYNPNLGDSGGSWTIVWGNFEQKGGHEAYFRQLSGGGTTVACLASDGRLQRGGCSALLAADDLTRIDQLERRITELEALLRKDTP